MYLSIIIPAHNEEARLQEHIPEVVAYCRTTGYSFEVIICENGSTDATRRVCRELCGLFMGEVRYFTLAERSKARAVVQGMRTARGAYRYMADVDFSTPIEELRRFLRAAQNGYDIVIGSREAHGAIVRTDLKRRLIGRCWYLLVRALTGITIRDTQCGFKMFRADAAEAIFPQVNMTSMAFDVQVLHIARREGFSILELPVIWNNDAQSRVLLLQDSVAMLKDLIKIKKERRVPLLASDAHFRS